MGLTFQVSKPKPIAVQAMDVFEVVAVALVAHHGMPQRGQVRPDLVRAPRTDAQRQQRQRRALRF